MPIAALTTATKGGGGISFSFDRPLQPASRPMRPPTTIDPTAATTPQARAALTTILAAQQRQAQQPQPPQSTTAAAKPVFSLSAPLLATRPNAAAPVVEAGRQSQVLEAGVLHGGASKLESMAEVMQLKASAEQLEQKLATNREKLAKTEASLLRANRTLSSERAMSNGKVLHLKGELEKQRQATAAATAAVAVAHQQQVESPTAVKKMDFAEKVRDAEAQLELKDKIESLQTELTQLSARHQEAATALEAQKLARAQTDAAALEATETAVAAAAAANEAACTTEATLGAQHAEAVAALEATHAAALEALRGEVETARAESEAMCRKAAEATAAEAEVRAAAEIAERAHEDALRYVAPTYMNAVVGHGDPLFPLDEPFEFEEEPEVPTEAVEEPERLVERTAVMADAAPAASAPSRRLAGLIAAQPRPALGAKVLIGVAPLNVTSEFPIEAEELATGDAAADSHVSALLNAVSQDVVSACVSKRRSYLTASGMSAVEIDAELEAFEVA